MGLAGTMGTAGFGPVVKIPPILLIIWILKIWIRGSLGGIAAVVLPRPPIPRIDTVL